MIIKFYFNSIIYYMTNIYTNPAFVNCSTNCNPDWTPCSGGLSTQTIPSNGITLWSYLCSCQEYIATEFTKNQMSANPYYAKLLYDLKLLETEGAQKYVPLFKNINAKQSLSLDGNSFKFRSFTNKRYSGEVLSVAGNTITVSDGNLWSIPSVSITITYPNPSDPCCPIEIARKCDEWSVVSTGVDAFGNPTATLDIGVPATDIAVGSTVMLRFDCLEKCERYPAFSSNQTGKEYTSYIQDFGRELCFDMSEINSCGFSQINQEIANEMMGRNIMNMYQYKQEELYDFFNHEFIMAINTGMNYSRGAQSGETMGIETTMNYARNTLGVKNYLPLTAVSPKAIFLRIIEEVMDRQKYAKNGNINYLVGTTQKGYARLLNNQEFLKQATGCTPQQCKSTNTIYVMSSMTIDTGSGTIEFAIDPYLEQKYAGIKMFRFLPLNTMLFMTNKYKTLTSEGKPIMLPQGLQVEELKSLKEGRYNCAACFAYSFGFSFIPLGILNGQAFTVTIP